MSKKIIRTIEDPISRLRESYRVFYDRKFFGLWASRFVFSGTTYQQENYLLKTFWRAGTVSMFKILPFTFDESAQGNDKIAFAPYAPVSLYNIYDFPVSARPINRRGVPFIPPQALEVDKDIVIGWATKTHQVPATFLSTKIDKLVKLEMLTNTHLTTLKLPFLIASSEEDKAQMEDLMRQLFADEPALWASAENIAALKTLTMSNPYIADKVQALKCEIENEVLTYIGVNNVPVQKKERLITDEAESNDDAIEAGGDDFAEAMGDFFERGNALFGSTFGVKLKESKPEEKGGGKDDENESDDGLDA